MRPVETLAVIGGAGYKGCVLVPKLLAKGYRVVVYDIMLYGSEGLPSDPRLEVIDGDIRDIDHYASTVKGQDAVINLACISNDPSFALDPAISRSINFDCFEPMVKATVDAGVSRYVYASTSSVYGVSDAPDVTEEHPLVPLTDYNKYKGLCEPVLQKYQSPDFTTVIIRPATVCGYSPRQRLDVVVNILTNLAYHKREISVFGGSQLRPNIHIADMVEIYVMLMNAPKEKIAGEIFNGGYENHSVLQLAETVRDVIGEDVVLKTSPTDDNRSYHVSSKKIEAVLGFKACHSIKDAVADLRKAFDNGLLPNSLEDERYFNIKRMQSLNLQ